MIKRIRDWLIDNHWLHDWEMWVQIKREYTRIDVIGKDCGGGIEYRQRRDCKRCGFRQDKLVLK